ncbi:MAG: hypothetical protein QOI35_2032 [Cryptosporangiaceae bacterium]|nr:hypothetical protein [Cryptosporangiaceae bacterium]
MTRPPLLRSGAVVAAGSMAANVLAFGLTLALGRIFSSATFGAASALLAVAIVGQVPAMALQVVAARRIALGGPAAARGLLARAGLVAGALGVLGCVAAVPLAGLLHLPSVWPVLWLVVTLVPTTLIFAVQGVLQGGERFEALAVLLAVAGLTRVAGGIAGTTAGLAGVFAGTAVGAGVALAVSLWLARRELRGPVNPQRIGAELLHAAAGLGALLALTNVDVILARHYLPPEAAGRYAAGAVAAKVAFWLPQAVAMVAFPRLTDPELRGALLTKAVAVVAGLGLATSAGAAVLGPWLFGHLLNPEYATLGPALGLFAAAGAAGTLVQLVLYTGIAAGERAIGLLLGGALVVLVTLVGTVAHGSVLAIVCSVLGVELVLAVAGLAVVRPVRTLRPATDPA